MAIAGIPEITIGETLADLAGPRPLPVIHVDEPSMSMTIGVNNAPLAGRDGDKMTGRLLKSRLDAEILGNVSIKVEPADREGKGERISLSLKALAADPWRDATASATASVKPKIATRMTACIAGWVVGSNGSRKS
jgi:predicted membrane GTPase involved in stress response